MATKGGRIDFMFLGPSPLYPAAGSATEVHFRKQELTFGLFAIYVAESLHGMTPLCNNTIHEIYINLSDNDGHSLMIARQLGVFMNTQLAIVALLPLFYSHICNFARYDDSKCYTTCRWV